MCFCHSLSHGIHFYSLEKLKEGGGGGGDGGGRCVVEGGRGVSLAAVYNSLIAWCRM